MTEAEPVSAGVLPDITLLAVALAAGLGATRLARPPTAAHVLLPIAACIVTGHLVVSLVRRLRLPDPLPSLAGVLSIGLMAVWTLIPGATRAGVPTATTISTLLHRFNAAGVVIRSQPTPVPAISGVVLCLAAGAGLAAVFARTLWGWQEMRPAGGRRPLVALIPTFGLFCYTALLSSDVDRVIGATLYLATAPVFLAVADRPTLTPKRSWLRSGTLAALAMTGVAVVVPLAASPALAGLRLDAIPFSSSAAGSGPGSGGSSGAAPVGGVGDLDLIDNLKSILTSRSELLMFDATSPTPTYWQVASLTRFNGTGWVPDPATEAAARGAPLLNPNPVPSLPEPRSTRTFSVQVTIGALRTILLPVPPDTVTVGNAIAIQIEQGIGVLQPFANTADLSYEATAVLPTPVGDRAEPSVAALDSSAPAASLAPYLALPSSIPPKVVALAHQIVAHAAGPDAEATALVRYFSTDRRFRYTITPPAIDASNALSSFLFTTRAGFCQQFAGAFAVLARLDGLPTRVAIGFTTGSVSDRDRYSVTGADAHSWPEVYLGPRAGWVSFEPTPASANQQLGTGVQNGSLTTIAPVNLSVAATTTTVPGLHSGHGFPLGAAARRAGSTTRALHRSASSFNRAWPAIVLGSLGVLAVVWATSMVGPWLWRRRRPRLRRRRFSHARAPTTEIMARWQQAEAVLARSGLGRRRSETLEEHALRLSCGPPPGVPTAASPFLPLLGAAPVADSPVRRAVDAYGALAALAARASYSPDPCTEADRAEARRHSEALRSALRRRTSRRDGIVASRH